MRDECVELTEVGSEARWRDGGVFPALPSAFLAGNEDGGAEGGLAHLPDAGCVAFRAEDCGRNAIKGRDRSHHLCRHLVDGSGGVRAKLAEKKAAPGGQKREVIYGKVLQPHGIDEPSVEAFETDRVEGEDFGHVVGGDEGVFETEDDQAAMLRARLELAGGFEDGDASAFGSDEGTGNVEAVFGQKFVEVVAGDASGNFGKAGLHEGRIRVAQALQTGVDLAFASAAGDDR